jgi:cytochrome P450
MTTSVSVDDQLTGFFSADPDFISWPYPMYHGWQHGTGAVAWDSGPALVLTRYADVKSIMTGNYPLGNDGHRFGRLAEGSLSRLPPELHDDFYEVLDFETLFMSRKDGGEHQRLRKIASRAFTARRIGMLRESIERHVDDLISEMREHETTDVKTQLANLLPTRVIADLIGVPESDRDMIWEWSEAVAAFFSVDQVTVNRAKECVTAFREYVGEMIVRVRKTGDGPELAKLLLSGHADEAMTADELEAMYLLILFGGSETTTNLLGNGFLALQRNRDQWDLLVGDPTLMPNAVEEMFRYDSPHHYLPRYALEDFEIAGRTVHKNDTVIVVQGAANRDELMFTDPDTFDIRRPNAREHLSLAFGPHFCLGAALARLEGEIVFDRLVTQFPQARLLTDDMQYGGSAMLRAIRSLPTDLGPAAFETAARG